MRHEGTKHTGGAAFVRDQLGRVTHEEEWVEQGTVVGTLPAAPSRVRDFTYDTLGRLKSETAVTGAGTRTRTYAYDANGNRTAVTDSQAGQSITSTVYDQQDRLIDYGTTHFEYTPSGERRERRRGDQTKTQYGYDELGALRWVRELDGSGYQTKRIDYQVDGEGHRIAKTVKVGGGTAQVVQRFVWSGALQLAEERNPNGSLKWTFAYASRPNVPDFMVGANGDVYRLVTDPLGSVRLVVNVSSGAVAQRLRYDAFGNVEEDTAEGFQPFGFAGGLYDPDTKLVRFGARDYDPEIGRWTAKDPLGLGAGANVHSYCENDPLNFVDPYGEDLWSASWSFAKGLGYAIGGGIVASGLLASGTLVGGLATVGMIGYSAYNLGMSLYPLLNGKTPAGAPVSAEERVDIGAGIAGGFSGTLFSVGGYARGVEFEIPFGICAAPGGKPGSRTPMRVGPWGNRTGNSWGEYPHYHRKVPHPNPKKAGRGEAAPGQGIGNHRPYEGGW